MTSLELVSMRNREFNRRDRRQMSEVLAKLIVAELGRTPSRRLSLGTVLQRMTGRLGQSSAEIGAAIDHGDEAGYFIRDMQDEMISLPPR